MPGPGHGDVGGPPLLSQVVVAEELLPCLLGRCVIDVGKSLAVDSQVVGEVPGRIHRIVERCRLDRECSLRQGGEHDHVPLETLGAMDGEQ